jgi:predicted phosphate transport protein (TIGR00153 family)
MKKKLLGWLDKRETTQTLAIARVQMKKALDTVYELDKIVREASQGDFENSKKSIELLFVMEEEVDSLRREVFQRLGRVEMSSRDREDLLHLVKRLDVMADYVKDSARSLLILSKSKGVPQTIWDNLLQTSKILVKCASSLRMGIEKLEEDVKKTEQYLLEVDDWEHKVDDQNLEARLLLISESKKTDPAILITLRDLLLSMEEIADSCADTADYMRVLIAGGLTSY